MSDIIFSLCFSFLSSKHVSILLILFSRWWILQMIFWRSSSNLSWNGIWSSTWRFLIILTLLHVFRRQCPIRIWWFFFLKKEILVSFKKTNDNQNAWLFHRLIYQEPTCVRTHTFISFMCVLRRKRPLLRLSKLISSCNRNYIRS